MRKSKIKTSYMVSILNLLKYTPLMPFVFIIESLLKIEKTKGSYIIPITLNLLSFIILVNILILPYTDSVKVSRSILTLDERREEDKLAGGDFNTPESGSLSESVITGVLDKETKDMLKDYLNAVHLASRSQGEGIVVPPWYIIGLQVLENSGLYQKSPPIPKSSTPFERYGTKRDDGSLINFVTWGIEDVKKYGDSSGSDWSASTVKGPFQFKDGTWTSNGMDGNNDGKNDVYNLYDAMFGAAKYATASYKDVKGKVTVQDDDLYWMWAAMAHNAGQGGANARVPNDVKPEFMNDLAKIKSDKDTMAATYNHYLASGRGWGMRAKFMGLYDKLGYSMSPQLASKMRDSGLILTQPTRSFTGWAGSTTGERGNAWSGSPGNMTLIKGNNGNDIRLNIESAEYVTAFYYIGRSVYEQLLATTGSDTTVESSQEASNRNLTVANLGNTTQYYWEGNNQSSNEEPVVVFANFANNSGMELTNPFESVKIKSNTPKYLNEGKLGEVGYKGTFPIFIQASNLNEVSKIPWKFKGSKTTLGQSGCGMFALTSLIHGAGYGDLPIPNYKDKPTMQNLARLITNGPFLADSVRSLGYTTKTLSTSSKNDLNILFNEVKEGTPYVVNTKYGEIRGYDYNGKEINTRFTRGGHFILLVGGFEKEGKRFVEVVQSTYSFAGTKDIDQNRMIFDWDHLVNNNIIRSSGGAPVPAYTIVGAKDYPTPIYLRANYVPPISINSNKVVLKREESLEIKGETLLNIEYSSKDFTDILLGVTKPVDGKAERSGAEVVLPQDMLVTRDKNVVRIIIDNTSAVEISDLKTDLEEKTTLIPKGRIIGITTNSTEVKNVLKKDDTWEEFDINSIDISED